MGIGQKLGSFFVQSKRVWHLLKKPSQVEFSTIAKVSALGVLIIGAIGFAISDLMKVIGRLFG
ncbi:protein translocase SEC61 complex subunit gamma [Candidatus Pacearchaeota archaeon]|nr:protein translocase SEC61 complex subunit gamma [Candidatus Pacearchaeota archaeon]|tara:strand:- start:159 stop:347 length:189 start_codon:yes stop_codon:yes gene_type:complete